MTQPFDPYNLTPEASTNRLVIASLPDDVLLDRNEIGKRADELASLQALNRLILQHADALRVPEDQRDDYDNRHLPLWFDTCFESGNSDVRRVAASITAQFGRRIGAILAVLVRGDEPNRLARGAVLDGYWEHWGLIKKIILGGGLLAGHMGERVMPHIRQMMISAGAGHVYVEHDLHFDALPMFGTARTPRLSQPDTFAPVFDFGRSSVKRGLAIYREGTLSELQILPTVAANRTDEFGHTLVESPEDHLHRIARLITDTLMIYLDNDVMLESDVAVSIASYIENGNLADRHGGYYTHLRSAGTTLATQLSTLVSDALGMELRVRLVHDGTSSALFYAGEKDTAVLSLGTSFGTGFAPPSAEGFVPLADDLRLSIFK